MGVRRQVAFRLAMSDRFESLVGAAPGARARAHPRARRYVAGETLDEALDVARDLLRQGLGVSLDAFGELVRDPAEAAEAAASYAALIDAAAALDGDVWISVDLSHIGLDISPAFCATQLQRITERMPAGMRLQVGAEDAGRCDAILGIVEEAAGARRRAHLHAPGQPAAQHGRHRARGVVRHARAAGEGRVRRAGRRVAFPYGPETDTSYVLLARALGELGTEVLLATHDPVLRAALAPSHLEMLLGVHPGDGGRARARGDQRANLRTVRSDVVPLLHAPRRRGAGLVTTRRSP